MQCAYHSAKSVKKKINHCHSIIYDPSFEPLLVPTMTSSPLYVPCVDHLQQHALTASRHIQQRGMGCFQSAGGRVESAALQEALVGSFAADAVPLTALMACASQLSTL